MTPQEAARQVLIEAKARGCPGCNLCRYALEIIEGCDTIVDSSLEMD